MLKRNKNTDLFVGALLRLCWQQVRGRMIEAIHAAGFTDLDEAQFPMFTYPPPDEARPSELARRLRMSRQAVNYLIAQLEAAGYLQRRTERRSGRRLVYLTPRGWQVIETMYAAARHLQAQWSDKVGRERFDDFMDVLRELAGEATLSASTNRPALSSKPTKSVEVPPMSMVKRVIAAPQVGAAQTRLQGRGRTPARRGRL